MGNVVDLKIVAVDEQRIIKQMVFFSNALRAQQQAVAAEQRLQLQVEQILAFLVMGPDMLRRLNAPKHITDEMEEFAKDLIKRIEGAMPQGGDEPRMVTPAASGIIKPR